MSLKIRLLLFLCFATSCFAVQAQTSLKGRVIDVENQQPIVGATVLIDGTSSGGSTDGEGYFAISTDATQGILVFRFIGYSQKKLSFSSNSPSLGDIALTPLDSESLQEVIIIGRGIIDVAEGRKTPHAVSTVTRSEILDKGVGNVEFPDILKNTPSVYSTDQAGGYGEGQVFVRGFDQSNTAYLLNGQPINGMEDGNMYWSNWQGMADVANAVQVQRGLGSSKLAISSVGGTVNILTKATDMEKGGSIRTLLGYGGYYKTTVGYNTGIKNKWGFSFMLDYWRADKKYAYGTGGQGQSYFFSVGYKPSEKHSFNFLVFGSPQWHDQNYSKALETSRNNSGIITYPGYDITGIQGNSNYGYLNGSGMSIRRNYYHKPVSNLNWDWKMSEKASLSTVLYASIGRGGGTGLAGNGLNYIPASFGGGYNENGSISFDNIYAYNGSISNGISSGYNGTVLRASANNHLWYGAVTNFNFDTKTNWSFNVGADIRFYKGDHFQQLVDTYGLQGRDGSNANRGSDYTVTKTFTADPWSALFNPASEEYRISYDNSEKINYQGGFGQVEYSNDVFSAFVQGSVSNQSYQKFDRWNYTGGEAQSTKENKLGYNVKGGLAFTIADNHTLFANAGYYSRQPFLDNVFISNTVDFADPSVDNEKILGLEAGYRLSLPNFRLNLNGYYTSWDNRFYGYGSDSYPPDPSFTDVTYLLTGIKQLHKGLELDFNADLTPNWMLRGYASLGDWKYDGSSPYNVRDNISYDLISTNNEVNLSGVNVGNAPQTSFGLGTKFNFTSDFYADLDWNLYDRLYGNVDVEDVIESALENEIYQSEELKSYNMFDIGATYIFRINTKSVKFRGAVRNLFDETYQSRKDAYGYFYGLPRTWTASLTYNF